MKRTPAGTGSLALISGEAGAGIGKIALAALLGAEAAAGCPPGQLRLDRRVLQPTTLALGPRLRESGYFEEELTTARLGA